MGSYSEKLILTGSVYEHYTYEKAIATGFVKGKGQGPPRGSPEDYDEGVNRVRALRRARQQIRRLINSNVYQYYDPRGRPNQPKFLTLTFKENVTDLDQANYNFKKFRQRLEYREKVKLKYLNVVEFQKRGAVHYHTMLFNLPYIPRGKIEKAWDQGFIKINAIKGVDNLGAYVSKYLRKEISDERLKGEKCYFSSRGLIQPLEIIEKNLIDAVLEQLPGNSKIYETTFESEFTGSVLYRQYNINSHGVPNEM